MREFHRTLTGLGAILFIMGAPPIPRMHAAEPMAAEKLEPMVVVATRTEKSLSDIPASAHIMDATAVRLAQAMTLDELFKAMPGVDIQDAGFPGGKPRVSLRGLTPGFGTKRVLVLVDGRRVNDAFQGNADFMLLPADAIDRVEILRGPASALYGSNAMGGVVNIVTRRGPETPVATLRAAAGSHKTRHFQASHGAKIGAVDFYLAGSQVETDGYTRNSDGSRRDWRADHGLANIGVALNDASELRLGLGAYRGRGKDEDADRDLRNDYQTAAYTLRWHEAMDARLTARVYRNGERHRYDWTYPGIGRYDQETLAAELQQALWTGKRHHWVFGGEFRREAVDIDEVTGPIDEKTDTVGWYLQDEIHATETLTITAGLRHDSNSDFSDAWSPRLGLLWQATGNAELFASANRAHRAPALSDRFVKAQYWGMTFEGNPDLDPETLTAYELGGRQRLLDNRLQAEASVFYNDMKDSFDFMRDPDGVFRNRNATRSASQGVETHLRYAPAAGWAVTLNYTFTEGEYRRFNADPALEGNRLPYLAENKAGVDVDFLCPLGWTHGARWRYVGSRQGDARNTPDQKMDAYMTVDWRTRIPVASKAALTLSVDNIFDETYRDFPNVDRPGRFVMAGIELAL